MNEDETPQPQEEPPVDLTGVAEPEPTPEMPPIHVRVKTLEEHHQTTVALMRSLADNLGLSLHQEVLPDGRTAIGWRPKTIQPGRLIVPDFNKKH